MSDKRAGIVSRLANRAGLVFLGNLFMLIAGIPFQIYLARTLGADQLGVFGLFEAIAQAATYLFGFGLGFSLVRFIPQHIALGQNRHVKKLLATVFLLTLLSCIAATVVITASSDLLMGWLTKLQPYETFFPFVSAMTMLGLLIGKDTTSQ